MTEALSPELESVLGNTKVMADQMKDPRKPVCCAVCFCSLANYLDNDPLIADVRQRCHEFLDACMLVATVPRNDEELRELRFWLLGTTMACTQRWPAVHEGVKQTFADPFVLFFDSIFRLLFTCCAEGDKELIHRAAAWKRVFTSKHGRWPTSPKQLFPLGERRTVDALLEWSCRFLSWGPILVLIAFQALTRLHIMPILVTSPVQERFVWLIVRMLRKNIRTPLLDWPHPKEPCPLPVMRTEMQTMWLQPGDKELVQYASGCLAMFTGPSDMQPEDVEKFVTGYETILYSAVQTGFEVAAKDETSLEFETLSIWTMFLHSRLRLPRGTIDKRVKVTANHDCDTGFHWTTMIYTFLHGLSNTRKCNDAQCSRFESDGISEGRFQVCSRCKLPRYCSRECQKRDWKEGVVIPFPWKRGQKIPHKTICPILCKIFQQNEVSDLVEWIVSCRVLPREVAVQFLMVDKLLPTDEMSSKDFNELVAWLGLS
ncbi:hypothetical protein EXIGLDRAFT_836366 [Exidia glandulosa HHB12029]|uniref:MYND-type domain-containing protein n=1 Tax=Exidia glandulosa HHB12029 TaxID=1314781 RepID=A0A165HWV0_EXIGL|nr:hypothetical protein EXIGLDRAFT_836366 [Exidia glandulosa HHB12029]